MLTEDRLIQIETKIAYHEDLIQSLNDEIVTQQRRIHSLEERFRQLLDRVAAAGPSVAIEVDERPPHY